jgi:hypothetical protein
MSESFLPFFSFLCCITVGYLVFGRGRLNSALAFLPKEKIVVIGFDLTSSQSLPCLSLF